ncbi:MAG TPA: hypothetical protein DIW81_08340 [Planctomycetaceae bacterium]|nr:hypothetical protein [Rubinisphaera sp.]HCS51588.1 hypothetical protein [Planctomycetaceae bacterium]
MFRLISRRLNSFEKEFQNVVVIDRENLNSRFFTAFGSFRLGFCSSRVSTIGKESKLARQQRVVRHCKVFRLRKLLSTTIECVAVILAQNITLTGRWLFSASGLPRSIYDRKPFEGSP